MKYSILATLLALLVFTGCDEKASQSTNTVQEKSEQAVTDESIKQVAQELKDKTSDVIDTAAKMAEELSQESKVIAKEMKEESSKVIKKIAKESKEMTDVAVEKMNEAKENFDVSIEQVIEDEKNSEPKFFVNPSSSDNTAADATTQADATTDESTQEEASDDTSTDALNSEENTQAQNLYLKCAGCHGSKGERAALNKSQIIKGWDAQQIVDALQGYKAGTYGSIMKGLMQGQVANLSDEEIQLLADYIASFE